MSPTYVIDNAFCSTANRLMLVRSEKILRGIYALKNKNVQKDFFY